MENLENVEATVEVQEMPQEEAMVVDVVVDQVSFWLWRI